MFSQREDSPKQKFRKNILRHNACVSKFFTDNLRNVFANIKYNGDNMTPKGYIARLKKATKLVSNAMELTGHWKSPKALQRTAKFFSIIYDYIRYRNLGGNCLEGILGKILRVWLRRIELKHTDQIFSDSELTDIEYEDKDIIFVNFSEELKDLHECILEIFMLSMEEAKRNEILYIAHEHGFKIPQRKELDTSVSIFIVIWKEFTKNSVNKFLECPSCINWGKCDFKCGWNRYRKEINRIGYMEQFPQRLDFVVSQIQEKLPN